jgi:AhpD family alkylhydroperoxidase
MAKTTHGNNGSKQIENEMVAQFGFAPDFYQTLPERALPAAWALHRDFELAETAIPRRYKELIGLAVAAHLKCRYCVYFHTEAARANGASDEELREAVTMGGLTVLFSNTLTGMQVDLDHFQEEVDRAVEHMTQMGGEQPSPSP